MDEAVAPKPPSLQTPPFPPLLPPPATPTTQKVAQCRRHARVSVRVATVCVARNIYKSEPRPHHYLAS